MATKTQKKDKSNQLKYYLAPGLVPQTIHPASEGLLPPVMIDLAGASSPASESSNFSRVVQEGAAAPRRASAHQTYRSHGEWSIEPGVGLHHQAAHGVPLNAGGYRVRRYHQPAGTRDPGQFGKNPRVA